MPSHPIAPGAFRPNTTDSPLFKLAIAAASFFAGALIGAYAPELVLKPTSRATTSTKEDDTAASAPLCVGPECAALPPAKLPSTVVPLSPPSPYHASRLTAVRASAASSHTIACLEQYGLIVAFLHLHSPPFAGLYADPQESLPALLAHLSSVSFTAAPVTSLSLSSLRAHVASGRLTLVAVQEGGEARWVAAVGVDAFYVYVIDPYTPDAVCFVPTREFVRQCWNVDEQGRKVTGEGIVLEAPAVDRQRQQRHLSSARLVHLRLEGAPEEHPAVEVASL